MKRPILFCNYQFFFFFVLSHNIYDNSNQYQMSFMWSAQNLLTNSNISAWFVIVWRTHSTISWIVHIYVQILSLHQLFIDMVDDFTTIFPYIYNQICINLSYVSICNVVQYLRSNHISVHSFSIHIDIGWDLSIYGQIISPSTFHMYGQLNHTTHAALYLWQFNRLPVTLPHNTSNYTFPLMYRHDFIHVQFKTLLLYVHVFSQITIFPSLSHIYMVHIIRTLNDLLFCLGKECLSMTISYMDRIIHDFPHAYPHAQLLPIRVFVIIYMYGRMCITTWNFHIYFLYGLFMFFFSFFHTCGQMMHEKVIYMIFFFQLRVDKWYFIRQSPYDPKIRWHGLILDLHRFDHSLTSQLIACDSGINSNTIVIYFYI